MLYQRSGDTKWEDATGCEGEAMVPYHSNCTPMVPLLHCEIAIGNDLLKMLHKIINELIENMTLTKILIQSSIPALRNIIQETAKTRDEWDASPDRKLRTTLKRTTTPTGMIAITIKALEDYGQKTFVNVLKKSHDKLRRLKHQTALRQKCLKC